MWVSKIGRSGLWARSGVAPRPASITARRAIRRTATSLARPRRLALPHPVRYAERRHEHGTNGSHPPIARSCYRRAGRGPGPAGVPPARRHRPGAGARNPALPDPRDAGPPGRALDLAAPRVFARAGARRPGSRPLRARRQRAAGRATSAHRDHAGGREPDDPAGRRAPAGRAADRPLMLEAVGMAEINKIFAVTDALGVHREALVIPLGTGTGRVRKLPSGKFEIIVDKNVPIDEWLEGLPALIQAATAGVPP